jgi:DNA-binding protein Fis
MNIIGSLSNLLGIGNNTAQQAPAQQAQSAPAQAQPHAKNENHFVAKALSQPTAQAQPDQAPVRQSIEQQIRNLFSNLFQTAPQNALNLLMELMGPFMEMMNGQPSAQPAAQASPTPQAGLAPQPEQASTNLDLTSLLGQLAQAPAQTPTGQARPAETNYDALLEEALRSALYAEQPAPAAAPTVQLDTQAKAKPSKTAQTTLAA